MSEVRLPDWDQWVATGARLLAAPRLRQERAQFRTYRDVAAKIPPVARVATSWTVHRDLRDQPHLMRPGLTVRQAAELLGKAPIDSKADRRLSVVDKAVKVRDFIADPDVYAVIVRTWPRHGSNDANAAARSSSTLSWLPSRRPPSRAPAGPQRPFSRRGHRATVQLFETAQLVHPIGASLDGTATSCGETPAWLHRRAASCETPVAA